MDNFYYHFFYLVNSFYNWVSRAKADNMRGLTIISAFQSANVFLACYYMNILPHYDRRKMILVCLPIYLPIILINYILLMRGKKDREIMKYYKNKYQGGNSPIAVYLTLLYFLTTLVLIFLLNFKNYKG